MNSINMLLGLSLLAGLCIPAGGLLASFRIIRPRWMENELRHFIIALGGGILIGAVTLVLIPEGLPLLQNPFSAITIIMSGGLATFLQERYLGVRRLEKPQLASMLLDYVPEAMALGGLISVGASSAPLLALLIGLQNLPEGFNAYRELTNNKKNSTKNTLLTMLGLSLLGPLASWIGYTFLSKYMVILGSIMLLASGGILYLIFQDIAPQSKLDKHWLPPLGAVLGYCLALFGQTVLGH